MDHIVKTPKPSIYPAPEALDPERCYIFTDGSAKLIKAAGCYVGGWAALLLYKGQRKVVFGGKAGTTISEMELTAIREGLRALKPSETIPVTVYSDSQYAVNCVVNWGHRWRKSGWETTAGEPVKHAALIEQILDLVEPRIRVGWIKGHAGNKFNVEADRYATEARKIEEEKMGPPASDVVSRRRGIESRRAPLDFEAMRDTIYGPELAGAIRKSVAISEALIDQHRGAPPLPVIPAPRRRVRTIGPQA